ncbi:peptide/nickel transport system permease protein [Rhodoligotrophos appendicifer]|uniref:ABC transporter permease n=1 Tax=Rhodoligotrophos appendicifer TaxID=987056 RepID=UPI00118677C9|nr:ABC transporter permease [Rhodoligotrophos appendicifer]
MVTLIAKRLWAGAIALLILLTAIFFATSLLPGDLAEIVLGRDASAEALQNFRHGLGLDQPLYIQYWHWLRGIFRGDLGHSLASGMAISDMLFERLGNTLFLALYAAVIAVPLALVLGILTALYRDTFFDRVLNAGTLVSISFPDFFVAYVLILLLTITFPIFPSIASLLPGASFSERLYVTFLPAVTLSLFVMAHMMRMTRAAIIDLLSRPYIEMADLKGLRKLRIIVRHALPNAWAPIVNVIAFNLAYLVLGVVVVEVVFAYPGLGGLLVDSVARRDIPVVQAACLFFACTYLLINLIADILAMLSNPRLRHPR